MALRVIVLGSAAGGGFPQWNCGCSNCEGVREGRAGLRARTQDSLAVSANDRDWYLLNASPDVLRQVHDTPALHPKALRQSPIRGVVLTNGDLDHVLGLFQLREAQPLSLYATSRVLSGLQQNAAFRTLQRFDGHLRVEPLELGARCELRDATGRASGILVQPVSVPGKPPLHLESSQAPSDEDNVALRVGTEGGGTLVYASAIGDARGVRAVFDGASALLLDGTFWSEEELPDLGVAMGPARTMAHQPVGGAEGSLRALEDFDAPRRIFTHLNNTNPLLDEHSSERATVMSHGWEVAQDGLDFVV